MINLFQQDIEFLLFDASQLALSIHLEQLANPSIKQPTLFERMGIYPYIIERAVVT